MYIEVYSLFLDRIEKIFRHVVCQMYYRHHVIDLIKIYTPQCGAYMKNQMLYWSNSYGTLCPSY